MIDIAGNWQRVCAQVAHAAEQAGRTPRDIRIVAVSKTRPVEDIQTVMRAGATEIGESYVQEAAEKIPRVGGALTWHMLGHLQRNKAARAVELFDVIHALDSLSLGAALARHGQRRNRIVRVLIEINIGGEASKHGVAPDEAEPLIVSLGAESWLRIEGLMSVPPPSSAELVRPHFRALRTLRDRLRRNAPENAPLRDLSMGMSDDFIVAIQEGATIVRIGRAIFGERG